jgi:5'(3')-deoxyribonucleotidase
MRITELLEHSEQKDDGPIVFVDMDGVLADLYNHAEKHYNVAHYKHMTQKQWEDFFKGSNAYELFSSIQPFPTANQLLRIVKKFAGGYNILSSPLNFDKEGSKLGKSEWLSNHIKVSPDLVIFDHNKSYYATQPDGSPNILIDDYTPNIVAWRAAGGIGIKYQADEDSLDKVVHGLKQAERVVNNFNKDK